MTSNRFARAFRALGELRVRFGLSQAGVFAFGAGLAVLCSTAVVFGGVTEDVTQHNGLSRTDSLHLRWFVQHRPGALVSVSRVFTEVGSPVVLALVAVSVAALLWIRGQRLALVLAPGVALAAGGVSAAVAKSVVGRSRPPVPLHLVSETGASFPSGHATDSTALLLTSALVVAVFVFRRPLARVLVVAGGALLSGAVGVSRLVLGVHWLTDVVAGWALGLLVALIVTIAAGLLVSAAGKGSTSTNRPRLSRVANVLTLARRTGGLRAA